MTITDFLQHWSLTENPFRGEEARSDDVFARMSDGAGEPTKATALPPIGAPAVTGSAAAPGSASAIAPAIAGVIAPAIRDTLANASLHPVFHSDFDKITGDLRRPSASVVFGEKGSGKTAIRLQITRRIAAHNAANPGAKVLLVAYDDLNPMLDRLRERIAGKSAMETLQKTRLVDHMDAILAIAVPAIVDAMLGIGSNGIGGEPVSLPAEPRKVVRRMDTQLRRDLLLLQCLYDRSEHAPERTGILRRRLRLGRPFAVAFGSALLSLWMVGMIALAAWIFFWPAKWLPAQSGLYGLAGLMAAWLIAASKIAVWDRIALRRLARRVRRQLRVLPRAESSFGMSLREIPPQARHASALPLTDSDEARYGALIRLRRVLGPLGYGGIIVIIDRVDEPTIISGDPDRMKAVVWPLLNNKFLQQEGVGIKMLLPMELRHSLFRESSAFFQEARLDKQGFIENLTWTGPMLFDLCEARLAACRSSDAKDPISLLDLFAADTTRQELIESLDKLHQPRDAFKLMYRCLADHCSSVTRGQEEWRIPRHTLLNAVRTETDRAQQVVRGIRPG